MNKNQKTYKTSDVYLFYKACPSENNQKMKVSAMYFGDKIVHFNQEQEIPIGKIVYAKCPYCLANDWNDNGNGINHYECVCCGNQTRFSSKV